MVRMHARCKRALAQAGFTQSHRLPGRMVLINDGQVLHDNDCLHMQSSVMPVLL